MLNHLSVIDEILPVQKPGCKMKLYNEFMTHIQKHENITVLGLRINTFFVPIVNSAAGNGRPRIINAIPSTNEPPIKCGHVEQFNIL